MGWAGPAPLAGPGPTQKGWADLEPRGIGSISAQTKTILSWDGSSPASRAGPGSVRPTERNPYCWARTNLAQHN